MKLILAGDTGLYANTDYAQFIYNCRGGRCRYPYKVPVPSLDAIQFYVYFGSLKPSTYTAELVSTCAGNAVIPLTTENYVVGQLPDGRYYGVFRKFIADPDSTLPTCFVISLAFTFVDASEKRYFSEEICIENCLELMEIKSCYPDGATNLGFDCTNIYFGFHAGDPLEALGNLSIRYYHRIFVRLGIVLNTSHKLTFKTYLTRNFKTEQQKIWELRCELLPEWYKEYFAAVIARGVVSIRETTNADLVKYTLNETLFEIIEEDFKLWKTTASLIEICRLYFGCDESACIPPCLMPPTDVTVQEPEVGSTVYTLLFTGGTFLTGETIEYQVRRRDIGALVQAGTINTLPLSVNIDGAATGFDPHTYCYTVSWRKACETTGGSFSDDFSDDFETGSGLNFSAYSSKDFGICGTEEEHPCKTYVFGYKCIQYEFAVAGPDDSPWNYTALACDGTPLNESGLVGNGAPAPVCVRVGSLVAGGGLIPGITGGCDGNTVWTIDAVLCDGTPYSNAGDSNGAVPDPICAREGTVVVGGNIKITDSTGECGGGHKDELITEYHVNEGPVEGVCEMTAQLVRTPAATADSVTNGHRIQVTVKFTGDQSPIGYETTLDYIFEIGDAYSNILVAHVHAGSSDYCSHIDTLITAVVVIP